MLAPSPRGTCSWSLVRSALTLLFALPCVAIARPAVAADQTILGQRLALQNADLSDPARRRVTISAREPGSANTITGDPTTSGSNGGGLLQLVVDGSDATNEIFALPQGITRKGKPFWKAIGGGYRYADPAGDRGPVESLVLRKTTGGTVSLRVKLSGRRSTLDVTPPNPGTGAFALLSLSGGDRYCVAYGPDATVKDDGARGFTVSRVSSESCPASVSGDFLGLTYNVAGLPEGISGSHPAVNTAQISPKLNAYDMVLTQEDWQTPTPNPLAPLRVYHEILVADATHPYKSISAPQPLGTNPQRPDALLADGLNRMARFPFAPDIRTPWSGCHNSAADCLALKGFSVARTTLAPGVEVDVYDLHMEAGGDPQDDVLRDAGISQVRDSILTYSAGRAVIVGGDFNLHTNSEPDKSQYARLLAEAGLQDVCTALSCATPGRIDKFAFRSGGGVSITPLTHRFETDVFVDGNGDQLSDHEALAVRFAWSR
jgi:hypothetical protein